MVALRTLLAAGLAVCGARGSTAQELRIAAASDLQTVLPALAQRFEQQSGVHAVVTFGSSGNLSTQIQNGAPFDLFFSADLTYPEQLERAGLVEPRSTYQYAVGQLVVWVRSDSGLDVTRGLQLLTDARVRHVAIANPDHAPYGRAAMAALEHEHLVDAVRPKLVLGENISQAAQFVQSGNAEVGILALSVALSPALKAAGRYSEIPSAFHPPLQQGAVILKSSKQKDAARRFLDFMRQPATVRELQASGFTAPTTK